MTNISFVPRWRQVTRQSGASLVEFLIGITIGLLVVLAATGTLVLNRTSSNTISDTANVTAQASNAMRQMVYTLRQTGATESTPSPDTASLLAVQQYVDLVAPGTPVPGAGVMHPVTNTAIGILSGRDNLTANALTYDEFTYVFASKGTAISRDCLGNQVAAINGDLPNRFFLQAENPGNVSDTNRPSLMCQGRRDPTDPLVFGTPQPVARNVEDLQIRYLVDQVATQTQQWRNAAQVEAAGAWNQVVAVEICLLVRGDVNHGAVLTGNYTNCNDVVTAHDRFWRVALRQTVQLRNRYNNL